VPIQYHVDHERKVVFAEGSGTLTDEDVFGYQVEVWSRPDVKGYHELMDMTGVETIQQPTPERIHQLAELSAHMDSYDKRTRFAIVAPTTIAFGLGKMFQAQREIETRSNKEVGVFRTRTEALVFLGLEVDARSER
jgi:hypothetical protein